MGYNVIINGKNLSKLKKASVSLDKCNYFLGDLTDKKKIKALIKKIKPLYLEALFHLFLLHHLPFLSFVLSHLSASVFYVRKEI